MRKSGVDNPGGRRWMSYPGLGVQFTGGQGWSWESRGQCSPTCAHFMLQSLYLSIFLWTFQSEFCPITTSVKSHLVTLVGDVVCFLLLLRQAPLHLINLPLEGAAKAGISPVATSGNQWNQSLCNLSCVIAQTWQVKKNVCGKKTTTQQNK